MSRPSTKDTSPQRDKLGPTGPAEGPTKRKRSYDEDHPHAGNVGEEAPLGPTPTDDPDCKADQLEKKIDRKRNAT
jgi:hypothetical protein